MKYQNLRDLVEGSAAEDWKAFTEYPLYRQDFQSIQGAEGYRAIAAGHDQSAVYLQDISLTMSWGYDPDHDYEEMQDARDLKFEWAPEFWSDAVRKVFVNFFWNAALVDRRIMLLVDGGRCYLPLPSLLPEGSGGYRPVLTPAAIAFARLLNEITNGQDVDDYILQTKLDFVPDDQPGLVR